MREVRPHRGARNGRQEGEGHCGQVAQKSSMECSQIMWRLEVQSVCREAQCEIKLGRKAGTDGGEPVPILPIFFQAGQLCTTSPIIPCVLMLLIFKVMIYPPPTLI